MRDHAAIEKYTISGPGAVSEAELQGRGRRPVGQLSPLAKRGHRLPRAQRESALSRQSDAGNIALPNGSASPERLWIWRQSGLG